MAYLKLISDISRERSNNQTDNKLLLMKKPLIAVIAALSISALTASAIPNFGFNPFSHGNVPTWNFNFGGPQFSSGPFWLPPQSNNPWQPSGPFQFPSFNPNPHSGPTFSFQPRDYEYPKTNGTVPDGGTTVLLLGAALLGMAVVRRRLA